MALQIKTERFEAAQAAVLRCRGAVDSHSFELLAEAIVSLLNADIYHVVVDLSAVEYVSSAGLAAFLGVRNDAEIRGGGLLLLNPGARVLRVLQTIGFGNLFAIAHSDAEAFQKLGIDPSVVAAERDRASARPDGDDRSLQMIAEKFLVEEKYKQATICYRLWLEQERDREKRNEIIRIIAEIAKTERVRPDKSSSRTTTPPPSVRTDEKTLEVADGPGRDTAAELRRPTRDTVVRERPPPSKKRKTVSVVVPLLVVVMGVLFLLLLRSSPDSTGAFRAAMGKAQGLEKQGRYAEALNVYRTFLARGPKSEPATRVQEEIKRVQAHIALLIKADLGRANDSVAQRQYDEAIEIYQGLKNRFSNSRPQLIDVHNQLLRTQNQKARYLQTASVRELEQALEKARRLYRQRQYPDARGLLRNVAEGRFATEPLRQTARTLIASIDNLAVSARKAFEAGRELERAFRLDEAEQAYVKAAQLYASGVWGRQAKDAAFALRRKQSQADTIYADVTKLEATAPEKALLLYGDLTKRYRGTKAAGRASDRIKTLASTSHQVVEMLAAAQALEARGEVDWAWNHYRALLKRFPQDPMVRKLRLTVRIETLPDGAQVLHGQKLLGRTPLNLKLGAWARGTLTLQRAGFKRHTLVIEQPRHRVYRVRLQRIAHEEKSTLNEARSTKHETLLPPRGSETMQR